MSTPQEFFKRQHEHLNEMETTRERAADTRQSFQAKISGKVNTMKASVEARQAQTEAAVEEWKRKREVNKLDNRARDLEDYAEAAMAVVNLAQEEAYQASLDASEARRQAEEVKAVATPA